jgi:hypothetical protein
VPASAPTGLAVLAVPGATDAAWPLARSVYAIAGLRPAVDDAQARVLCGEPPAATASPDLRDLADTVAAVHGDDAPSRAVLIGIAQKLHLRGVVVVQVDGGRPAARVFIPDGGTFDAATYAPDAATDPAGGIAWTATARSLERAYGAAPAGPAPAGAPLVVPGPTLATRAMRATREAPKAERPGGPVPFYQSGWFWGAIGAAALLGGAAFLATRDSSPKAIHLEVQVPQR